MAAIERIFNISGTIIAPIQLQVRRYAELEKSRIFNFLNIEAG